MTTPVPYGIDANLPTANLTNFLRLAEVLGTTTRRIEEQGCDAEMRDLIEGRGGDPLDFREMGDADAIQCCPVAYALWRHGGLDPAALTLLERISCIAEIEHPHWRSVLSASACQTKGEWHMRLRAAMAPGVIWRGTRGTGYDSEIRIDPALAGIPETVLACLHERQVGRPLAEIVSHPLTDPLGLAVTRITEMGEGILYVRLDAPPGAANLLAAAEAWNQDRAIAR